MSSRTIAKSAKQVLMLIVAAGIAGCASAPNPAPMGTDTIWHGNLTRGSKFGATIGQTAYDAQQKVLAAGYGFEGEFACLSGMQAPSDDQIQTRCLKFQPAQLGTKGHIYLRVENGVVSQIVWDLTPVAYLDG